MATPLPIYSFVLTAALREEFRREALQQATNYHVIEEYRAERENAVFPARVDFAWSMDPIGSADRLLREDSGLELRGR